MTSPTWHSEAPPIVRRPGPLGLGLVAVRGLLMILALLIGLAALFAMRLTERGMARPRSNRVTQITCRVILWLMGLRVRRVGAPLSEGGAVIANHSSWLDILVLNAGQRITFVSKAEVAGWPGIGTLARATGTLFIARDRQAAAQHVAALQERIEAGQQLLFFPEGTSTDGRRVLPFKSTLFAAFLTSEMRETIQLQPTTLHYAAPEGADVRFYGWWGDMDLGPHLLQILSTWRQGDVTVTYGATITPEAAATRKTLAKAAETAVRSAHSG